MRVSWSGGFGSTDIGGRMGSKNIKSNMISGRKRGVKSIDWNEETDER